MARINKLPRFEKIKVKVKARAGFTFIDPSAKSALGHPLLDDKGFAYTDDKGDVLLFERKTLPNGWVGEVRATPEVESGLQRVIRRGLRGKKTTVGTALVKMDTPKEGAKPKAFPLSPDKIDKPKKPGGK